MILTPNEVVNFYLNNPPFEMTNTAQYTSIVAYVLKQTLLELSENSPTLAEKEFTTPNSSDDYILIDIYTTIDENFMSFIYLSEKNKVPNYIPHNIINSLNIDNISLLNIIALRDGFHKLKEYTTKYIQKIIFENKYIKLLPNTEYYCVYQKYKTIDDILQNEILMFTELFEINLFLRVFQSSSFTTEQGIRSVSISGLSVTLNVPTTEQAVRSLEERKNKLLNVHSLNDYTDLIGHF